MNWDSKKQEIKSAIAIVDLVSQYTTLQPSGRKMKGLSPFTNEKTPSFFVDPEAGVYYCFSSQKGGDIFTFVQEMEGVNFKEAMALLADRAGVDLETRGAKQDMREPLYRALEAAAARYRKELTDDVRQYLLSRGLSEQSLQLWGIGYVPDSWHTLCAAGMQDMDAYVRSGVCAQKETFVYDRFRGRVLFPFYDVRSRVIGFSGRAYGTEDGSKYINSPESPLFVKSTFLYGLHAAKPHIRRSNFSILTEGPIDTIMVHQAGYPVAVAASGTSVTENHVQQLQMLSNRLLIAFDGDGAGTRATIRVIALAIARGMDVKVIVVPDGDDPATLIAKDASQFKELLREAQHVVPYMFQHIAKEYGDNTEDVLRGIRESMFPLIACAKDPLMRDHLLQETASHCTLTRESVEKSLEAYMQQQGVLAETARYQRKKPVSSEVTSKKHDRTEDMLMVLALADSFLKQHNVAMEGAATVLSSKELPAVEEGTARLRYTEWVSDTEMQVTVAKEEYTRAVQYLQDEMKREAAAKKLLKE